MQINILIDADAHSVIVDLPLRFRKNLPFSLTFRGFRWCCAVESRIDTSPTSLRRHALQLPAAAVHTL